MKKLALIAAISVTLLMSGCARQMADNPEYYRDVQTLNVQKDNLTFGELFYIYSVEDKTVPMNVYAIATDEGDGRIKIAMRMARQDSNLIVASSNYIYKITRNGLTLIEHIPEQTGLIGSWWIPRLDSRALNVLQASKPAPTIWVEQSPNHFSYEAENFVATLTPPVQLPTSLDHLGNEPSLRLMVNANCKKLGIGTRPEYTDVGIGGELLISAIVSCNLAYSSPEYSLNNATLAAIRAAGVQGLKNIKISTSSGTIDLPLSGFNYAYSMAQRGVIKKKE
ncbi:hypothetical protein A1OQ_17515 [Enterovibrio norvegicus FF-162]|uniref:hypothetical protein n=1 Tax=Enterovibrio norvegicus TaxID=188144 RepID=UPI0002EE6935|nr:hypothetical protein [Enterovibrio norvegicus]OEE85939.1 hypothetical protein A1OQ_17515 [Enterovibrio norvegicus FF-162]